MIPTPSARTGPIPETAPHTAAPVRLTKHHGLGNDFLVVLAAENPGIEADPARSVAWCHRHLGIGADGVLWGLPPVEPGHDVAMVLHNSDGSEAEISGNGLRCLAQAVLRSRGARDGIVRVETVAGVRHLEVTRTDDPDTDLVRVEMGRVIPGPPVGARIDGRHVSLSVGNPHLVVAVEDLASCDVVGEGRRLETTVPGGINVHFLQERGGVISVAHWERGAGATLACGSGAVACAVAAFDWGLCGPSVQIEMPGGAATVELAPWSHGTGPEDGPTAVLIGPATYVAQVWT